MLEANNRLAPSRLPIAEGRFSAIPRPFLRWAGSKQALLQQIVPLLPKNYGRYYEPFLGSGALFFYLKPSRATLTDVSAELIGTWVGIRDHCKAIIDYLRPLKPNKKKFYQIRENRSTETDQNAAEFIYLNRTCWNGLYRVNSAGKFNVPYGAPKTDFIFDEENFRACCRLLNRRGITIRCADFEDAAAKARCGDLVFFDPPYVTKHNFNGFRDWNERLFSWSDQVRLATVSKRLVRRGVRVVVSNAEHEDIAALYRGFAQASLRRASTLASDSSKRGPTTEALFYHL